MSWDEQLDQWGTWLDDHRNDPAVIAGAARIGRLLAGDAR